VAEGCEIIDRHIAYLQEITDNSSQTFVKIDS
jgi:hypothetical protein